MESTAAPDFEWPDRLGLVEWFTVGEYERVEQVLADLRALGVRRLRTGLHWADCHRPDGPAWYDWLLPRLTREVEVLPCLTYTPPSLAVAPEVNAPPRDTRAYADFVDMVLTRWGRHFGYVELWNEPNNRIDWDFNLDPGWAIFSDMITRAAYWARARGWKTVLGGASPPDASWLRTIGGQGVLEHCDVVGIHGFPGVWDLQWAGWVRVLHDVREAVHDFNPDARIWITEAGHSTLDGDEEAQVDAFGAFEAADVERGYWYAIHDLDPARGHQGDAAGRDELHYHMGLRTHEGRPKLLHKLLEAAGVDAVRATARP